MLRNIALFEKYYFLRIKTDCQIIKQDIFYIFIHLFGISERMQGVVIGDKNIAVIFILQINKLLHRPKIVANMRLSRRLNARQKYFLDHAFILTQLTS